ncbi:glycerophosphodiester phosphodiesterase, partial [Enterococcus faecium]
VEEQFNGFLNIELKTDIIHYEGIEKKIVQQMKQKNWPFRYLYSSFYFPSLVKLKKADPKTEIAFIYESAEDLSQAGPAFALVDSL